VGETTNHISRREILKRGAFVGGAVVWATPVVQTLGMGRAFAAPVSKTCIETTALKVIKYVKGTRKNGSALTDPTRTDPTKALGASDGGFVSLGYGGLLILKLKDAYFKGNAGSALAVETTFNNDTYPVELAEMYVSGDPDGGWVWVGTASNKAPGTPPTTVVPLDGIAAVPPVVRYVRLVDATVDPNHVTSADGYDVDAVGITCVTGPQ